MQDSFNITQVKTGEGFGQGRVAMIVAPENAPPGSLESLTRFFNEHECKALPGYTGKDKHHVLRVRGFQSDEALKYLLLEQFPKWEQQEGIQNKTFERYVNFSPDLTFDPMEETITPNYAPVERLVKEHSTDLAALSYGVGNIGLVFSALNTDSRDKGAQWGKMVAPVSYTLSSALLLLLNRNAPEPREVQDIITELGFTSGDNATQEKMCPAQENIIGHANDFVWRHPWEISAMLNMIGAGSHAYSSFSNDQKVEAMAAMSTLTAMAIATFVPEKGGRSMIDFSEAFQRPDGTTVFESVHRMLQNAPLVKPVYQAGKQLTDWVTDSPLRASAIMQAAGNAGYATSALAGEHKDMALLGTSATYLAGNAFQSISSKGQGPGFDDVVTTAAAYIEDQTNWTEQDRQTLRKRIAELADALAEQPEIVQSEQKICSGIESRLSRFTDGSTADTPRDYLEGFIPMEKAMLKESPFISPRVVERVLSSESTSFSTGV